LSDHLDLLLPEWQGYGENRSVFHGALTLGKQLSPALSFETIDIPDHEDLEVENGILGYRSNLRILRDIRDLIENEDPVTIFLVGGTCASEIAPVSFLNQKYQGDLTVLWFDAHGDLNTPQSSSSRHFHGMPLRILLGDGPKPMKALVFEHLLPSQVILAGIRDLDPPEIAYVDEHRVATLSTVAVAKTGSLESALRKSGSSNLYIHLDLDVLEPDDFPHQLIPTPGGLMFEDLMEILGRLRDEFFVIGSSIVEYVPVDGGDPERIDRLVEVLRPQGPW
jgi:arginase